MKSYLKSTLCVAALCLSATPLFAQSTVDAHVQSLVDQGYMHIEISKTFLGRTKIEATKNGMERELIVNRAGELLRDHSEAVEEDDDLGEDDDLDDDGVEDDENEDGEDDHGEDDNEDDDSDASDDDEDDDDDDDEDDARGGDDDGDDD